MNKIFRIVWSHATQSWVVVSELTKAHKKQSRNSLKAVLGGALVLLSINTAEAVEVTIGSTNGATIVNDGTTKTGDNGTSIGVGAETSAGRNNIAIGRNAKTGSDGAGRTQGVNQSIAIGTGNESFQGARAYGDQSIAIGSNTIADGNSSIAIGNDDVDTAVGIATTYTNSEGKETTGTVGQAYNNLTGRNLQYDGGQYKDTKAGQAAVAIGVKAQAGDISVALGAGASAEKTNAVAFGTGATASLHNSVALGGGSLTDIEGTKETSTTVNGHTYNWSGGDQTNKGDIVSFGKKGFERQLKNVAAGKVSEESTDAINGSQLHGILNSLTIDPVFSYAGDNAAKDEVKGADVNEKKADAATKKIVVRSFKDGRLNLLGGATGELSDNNIGVNYDSENTIKFKLAKALTGLTSTDVGGIVTNAGGINMNNKPITNLAEGTNSTDAVNKSQLDKVATNNIKLGGDSGTTDAQQLDQTGGLQFNVKGTNGLTTTASGKDVTVKLDDATKAAVDSIANKIENNKIKLSATNDSSSTSEQDLNKAGGIEFKVKGDNGLTASASGDTVTLKLNDATKDKIDNAADKNLSNITDAGKKQIKDQVTWKAKANNSGITLAENTVDDDNTSETIGADGILTLDAGKNLRLQRKGKVFTYGLESNLTGINSITGLANTLPVTKNDAAAPTTNQPAPTNVDGTKAASVNDILNAGWNLKENDTDKDFVKAYDTVKFVDGTGTTANVTVTENGAVSAVKFDVKKTTIAEDTAKAGTMKAGDAGDSFATANDVANAINSAYWKVTGAKDGGEFAEGNATTEEAVKAGDKVTFKAGENIKLKQAGKDFTYSLNPVLSNITSIGGNETTMTFNPNGVDLGNKNITGVKSALNTNPVDTTPEGSPTPDTDKPSLVDLVGTKDAPVNKNAAATVGDLQNMGWLVSSDKTTDALGKAYKDTVKNANEVKFIGTGAATVSGKTVGGIRTITVDVKQPETATLKSENGKVIEPADALADAKKKLADNPDDEAAKKAVEDAQNAVNNAGNQLATASNVAEMINKSGFNLKTSADKNSNGEKAKGTKDDGELINPGATVEMVAGKNMSVKQDADGKVTYATKEDVEFTSVKLGKAENGKQPVNLKTENATPADNNQDSKAPTTALNFSSGEGDKATPTQLKGVGSVLNTNKVPTAPEGTTTPEDKQPKLVNLGSEDAPLSDDVLNSAATVRDLANMGWVVGTPENGYVDTVKNANKVDFKGENGISVTGKTNKEGVREITISVAEGKVTSDTKEGSKFVTGNSVATAIQESGWNIGKAEAKDVTKAFETKAKIHDKVNPNDDVKFVDGQNTVVKMVTVDAKNEDGSKKTTTFVKVDVTGLPVQYTDKNGTPVTKVGDKYFTVDKDGNPTTTEVAPENLTTNMVNPAAKPNEIGVPTTLGNVKSNLPSVNDKDKNAKDVDGNPIAGRDNKSAPIDVAKVADIAKNTGNNAATVSDVLNAGWNLQNNGEAKDFVKPYDTVNFVDGKGTKAVVETTPNGTTSNVKFDVDTGTVTSNKDGSVSGPVTPEMQKSLDDAKKALADATTPEAKKAAQDKVDAAQANINNSGNQIATAQDVADAINNSGFTLTTSVNGGKKLSGDDEIINPGKKVDLAAGKNMTVRQDAEGKVTYATADEVNFSSVQFGDNGPKINAAGDNINIGDKDGKSTKITGVKAGDISPTSTDAVNGAQIYALSRGNVPNVENITVTNPDGSKTTYKDIIVDENGTAILKTYNVQGQKEIITNSVVEAIHNMNEQGIKFFHSNDGVNRPKMETENNFDSSASGKFATAIGSRSKADGTNAVAIGFNSVVTGNDSISIGTGNRVTGNNSGAFGDPSTVSGQGSYSVGNNNTVATNDTFVLGNDVKHTVENSVILGAKSTATAGDGSATATLNNIKQDGTKGTSTTAGSVGTVTTATVGNMTYGGFQGAKADGVVSVGAAGNERRIQNVAAGEISSTSTDAINGSQLYSVANGVGNRINNLQGQINKLGKRMNAGVAGAMAAANLMQPHKPGQSAAMAAIGQHHGEAAVAVGYSRISDNGKYGVKLSVGANTQGQLSTGAGVSYFW
ncbi:ESPR-type extended signal peptide-containing protein [Haemophilus haemolyticus]|uniref:ESPR-type extended signal peptide-containing protein n=1 Tax=Haemophilus haemolyticus TaxID=726 RepID=UPI00112E9E10|nr:ESPR-type extended signal peptide-containing protein [Haemophilus haemolyticus]TPH11449.1 hypothetical protein EUX49_00125 [Haemophilus haemolyticus]